MPNDTFTFTISMGAAFMVVSFAVQTWLQIRGQNISRENHIIFDKSLLQLSSKLDLFIEHSGYAKLENLLEHKDMEGDIEKLQNIYPALQSDNKKFNQKIPQIITTINNLSPNNHIKDL